jgi:hypothetical protein
MFARMTLAAIIIGYATASDAATAPASLKNKSFLITWNEDREASQGGGRFRQVSIPIAHDYFRDLASG